MMASLESSPLLFATVLMDPPGSRTARQLGKTQVSSLLRFFFNGDIIVWRNFPEVLYPVARVGVHEFDFIPASPLKKDAHLAEIALKAKLQLAESLIEWKMSDSSHGNRPSNSAWDFRLAPYSKTSTFKLRNANNLPPDTGSPLAPFCSLVLIFFRCSPELLCPFFRFNCGSCQTKCLNCKGEAKFPLHRVLHLVNI